MTYNVDKAINNFGKDRVLELIFSEGLTQVELHKLLGLSTSDSRLNSSVYSRIYKTLGISELPYSRLSSKDRKFQLQLDRSMPEYWNNLYLVENLLDRLSKPTINKSGTNIRYVINFPRHPRSNKDSNQVKAHIVAWEIYNKCYLPDNYRVIAIDGNYLNLLEDNLTVVETVKHRSDSMLGDNNPQFLHGMSGRPKLGGWNSISKLKIAKDGKCAICDSTKDLLVHHVINYNLFINYIDANKEVNLLTLCRPCHGLIHTKNSSIKVHIEATQYSKLLELLETLKSQVPDSLMETYKVVEKQLGLTDNQQARP
jgi:hypothetical protein